MCLNVIMEIYQQVELLQVEIVGILCVFLHIFIQRGSASLARGKGASRLKFRNKRQVTDIFQWLRRIVSP